MLLKLFIYTNISVAHNIDKKGDGGYKINKVK